MLFHVGGIAYFASIVVMKLLSPAISRLVRLRSQKIEDWRDNPIAAQREVLQDLVTHAQYTEFGRKYGFNELFNIRKFKATVPIHEYDDLKPYIQRILDGEEHVLWNTPVAWMAKSSGTTNDKSKFIPITEESLEDCHYQGAKDVLSMYYMARPESDLLTGKGLVIGGSHQVSQLNEALQFGDLSAVLLQNAPFYGQLIRTPDLAIALMDEWETKIEALAQSTLNENVTSISGVPTWTLVLIKRILEISGKQTLKEVWPSLELYIHGGVSFTPYRQQFTSLLGSGVAFMEMYNASEGFFAAQESPETDGMLLFLQHGIFYEFMPLEEYGKPNPTTIGLKSVEIGKPYALVISTNGGLWRYLVGDTIEFVSLYPFRVKVVGRVKHFINAFGEELMVHTADTAIAEACAATQLHVNDYTAAPIFFGAHHNGAHEWLIEFEHTPNAEALATFTQVLDTTLQRCNSDYEAKRHKNIALNMPVIHRLPKGSFNTWLKGKGKLGGQHKVPRLSNDRKYIDDIKRLLQLP